MEDKPDQDTDRSAIACLILGILHVVIFFGVANYIPFFALGVTPIFGGLGLKAFIFARKKSGIALVGLVCNIIGLVFWIWLFRYFYFLGGN